MKTVEIERCQYVLDRTLGRVCGEPLVVELKPQEGMNRKEFMAALIMPWVVWLHLSPAPPPRSPADT